MSAHRYKMAKIWRSKAWKKRIVELVKECPRCEYCNGHSQTANHKRDGYYPGYELCRREEVDVVCNGCNEFWKKHKQKRSRLYDDCTECNAIIYQGRKICYNCGGKVASGRLDVSSNKQRQYNKILGNCPSVRMGDRWKGIWLWTDDVRVTGFEEQTDLPWPLVVTDKGEVGLPAFTFGKCVEEGKGVPWQSSMGWSEIVVLEN